MNRATSYQIVLPQHCNGYASPRLFGGQLMAWIDIIGAVAARQFAHSNVTTACIDNLQFMAPAHLNDVIFQEAYITWTGSSSMEVRVDTYVEKLDGSRHEVNRAYLVYVALDENECPHKIHQFTPITQDEIDEWMAAERRRKIRLESRN